MCFDVISLQTYVPHGTATSEKDIYTRVRLTQAALVVFRL